MPALYDYPEALSLMKLKGFYAIAAPTGQKNEMFFVEPNGCLKVYKPIPGYPTTDVAVDSPYTLQQLETSGWVIPNYYCASNSATLAFLTNLDINIAKLDGVIGMIRRETGGFDFLSAFETARGLLEEMREQIKAQKRSPNQDKKRLKEPE